MKKKTLLMVALCTATLTLVACGSNETPTDATATGTSAPTQSVTDDVTDTTVTEPTVAPVKSEIDTPTSTPTEAPTPTPTEAPTPTPTEAPKKLTVAERYAVNYPFMEVEIFEDITCMTESKIRTGSLICFKNNSSETYTSAFGSIKPGTGLYFCTYPTTDVDSLYERAAVYPATVADTVYIYEDMLQTCEDENCLFTTLGGNLLWDSSFTLIFYNSDGTPVYTVDGWFSDFLFIKLIDNQIHVDISGFSDVDWTTAKIVYNANEY